MIDLIKLLLVFFMVSICCPLFCQRGLSNDILLSESHLKLENYDTVITLLLPYSFDKSYHHFFILDEQKAKIDSMLYLALEAEYSYSEMLAELDLCIDNIILERPPFVRNELSFTMFDRVILIPFRTSYSRRVRKIQVENIEKEQAVIDSLINEMYDYTARKIIKDMRLYKFLEEK